MQPSPKITSCLFTDGSVNPQSNIGYGAYLIMQNELPGVVSSKDIKTKRFENTSSTKLELETLLWALSRIDLVNSLIIVYTDCQNIIGLKDRRKKLEFSNYTSRTGKLLKNHELYKEFYKHIDTTQIEFIKVKGHKKKNTKDAIDEIFTLVDKVSRYALRKNI